MLSEDFVRCLAIVTFFLSLSPVELMRLDVLRSFSRLHEKIFTNKRLSTTKSNASVAVVVCSFFRDIFLLFSPVTFSIFTVHEQVFETDEQEHEEPEDEMTLPSDRQFSDVSSLLVYFPFNLCWIPSFPVLFSR